MRPSTADKTWHSPPRVEIEGKLIFRPRRYGDGDAHSEGGESEVVGGGWVAKGTPARPELPAQGCSHVIRLPFFPVVLLIAPGIAHSNHQFGCQISVPPHGAHNYGTTNGINILSRPPRLLYPFKHNAKHVCMGMTKPVIFTHSHPNVSFMSALFRLAEVR